MTWSYTGPSNNLKDRVRFELGDTKETSQSLSDEEITFLLSENDDDIWFTAADAADKLANKYLQLSATTKTVGPLTISNTSQATKSQGYRDMANRFRMRGGGGPMIPYVKDESPNIFSIGMNDAGASEYTDPRYGWERG